MLELLSELTLSFWDNFAVTSVKPASVLVIFSGCMQSFLLKQSNYSCSPTHEHEHDPLTFHNTSKHTRSSFWTGNLVSSFNILFKRCSCAIYKICHLVDILIFTTQRKHPNEKSTVGRNMPQSCLLVIEILLISGWPLQQLTVLFQAEDKQICLQQYKLSDIRH